MTGKNEEVCDAHVEGDECPYCEIEKLKSQNRWAELDIEELVDSLGVRTMYWNGVHQAYLNGTNVPVEFFKSKQECKDWCDAKNKDATETPTIEIKRLKAENSRLQLVAGRYQFMWEAAQLCLNKIEDMLPMVSTSSGKTSIARHLEIYTEAVSKPKAQIGK